MAKLPITGSTVHVENENFERAMRKFKKLVQGMGILNDLKKREFYEKPTAKRKREKNQSVRRAQKLRQMAKLPQSKY
jgi:small subunit ribosomal protein S21